MLMPLGMLKEVMSIIGYSKRNSYFSIIKMESRYHLSNGTYPKSHKSRNKKTIKMKKAIILLVIAFISFSVYSQSKDKELSNAEVFSAKAGALMQKEFVDIGNLKKCKIQVVYFTDLISNTKQSALRFEYEVASTYSSDTKMATLDPDEVDGLMKSIKLMQDKIIPTNPINYTEVYYRTRGGFEGGCFKSKDSWSTYLKLQKFDSKSYVFLNIDDLATLYTYLEQAKLKL
jgi:hypothetical protein